MSRLEEQIEARIAVLQRVIDHHDATLSDIEVNEYVRLCDQRSRDLLAKEPSDAAI